MMMKRSGLFTILFAAFLFVACGPPTMESQTQYFQQHMDKMDALGAKNPQFKLTLEAKKVEFRAEYEGLKAGTGEEGARALAALNQRVSKFMNDLVPPPDKAAPPPGSKLGTTAPGALPGAPGQPVGGQLPSVPGAVPAQPAAEGGSGFGSPAPTPAPVPTPTPAQPAQPTGGSGFGGQ